jgi:hypothetical protein
VEFGSATLTSRYALSGTVVMSMNWSGSDAEYVSPADANALTGASARMRA